MTFGSAGLLSTASLPCLSSMSPAGLFSLPASMEVLRADWRAPRTINPKAVAIARWHSLSSLVRFAVRAVIGLAQLASFPLEAIRPGAFPVR